MQHRIVTHGPARTEKGERILSLSDYGYDSPGGCLGINCGHMLTPFIVGANYKPELGEDVKSITPEQAIENANLEAKQRALERAIRANKEKLHVAEKLGDTELISRYKSKVRTQQSTLLDYIDQHPFLKRDRAREKYHPDPVGIAKQEDRQRKHLEKVQADYEHIKKILGKNAPATMAKYQRLLYNSGRELEELKEAQKWVQTTFPTKKSFEGHFADHGKEFEVRTAEEYQAMDARLLSQAKSDKILGYDTETRRVRYDRVNNAIAIGKVNKNGIAKITTFFKPKNGEEYYHNDYEAEHRHD